MLFIFLFFLIGLGHSEEWTRAKVIASIEDPPLRDIFESAAKKLEGLKADTDLKEVWDKKRVFLGFLFFFFFFSC